MTQEKLTDAVTELDSDILERYFRMKDSLREKKKPMHRAWIKWTAMAACFCLIATLGAIGLFMKDNPDTPQTNFPGKENPDTPQADFPGYVAIEKYFLEGDVCIGKGATITHKGFDETSITLHIEKNDETPLTLYFRGLNEGEAEAIFSSVEDLIFTVNGARADSIPTAPGEYEVKIDYSKFITKCDQMDTFLHIKDYGHFSLNGEGLKIAGIEDIEDISEWEPLPFDVPENFSPWFD